MKIITFINSKGGVGKTTSAFCVGTHLQAKGYKVLFIDTDSQRNLTSYLKGNINANKNIYTLLTSDISAIETIQQCENNTHLIGASYNLDLLKLEGKNKAFILRDKLKALNNKYDYVLIDTPPHFNDLVINALVCSDYVIVTTQAEVGGYIGLDTTLNNIKQIKTINKGLQVLGVLLTFFNSRAKEHLYIKDNIKALANKNNTSLFNTYIRRNIALSECELYQEPINIYAPSSNGNKDYLRLTDEIIKRIKKGK